MHLLFDLDGTLTDPQQGMVACFRYALSKLNIEVGADTRLESFIGPPLRDSFRSLCGDDSEVEAAVGFYRERFATIGLFENRVYDGIPRCLEQLRTSVESIHLATSKPTIYAERIIRHFDLERFFDAVYGSELDGRWDDKSELIHHIVRHEKLNTANTFMIGDRSFDVIGARNNNLRAIGVLWGYGSEAELEQAGADRICSHPAELTDHLLC
jgi:phosphoglycolate phosphatase